MKKFIPVVITFLSLLITFALWINSKADLNEIYTFPLKSLDQISALLAVIFLSFEFFLATRVRFIEFLFDGLDKVYKAHHTSGAIGFSLLLLHPIFLILNALPNSTLALNYILPSNTISYTLGVIAFYMFTLLIICTMFIKLPYKVWRQTHILFGVPLLFLFFHVLIVSSDISNSIPLKIWILSFIALAILSYIYKRFLYKFITNRRQYIVTAVNKVSSNITEIYLKPVAKKLIYKPGQFAFIKFNGYLSGETHPFTLSSNPNGELLRISVGRFGKYTQNITNLNVDSTAEIYGPYGNLGNEFEIDNKDQVWIAGGIGITPFISRLATIPDKQKIYFYYLTNTREQAIYDNEIKNEIVNRSNISYLNHISSEYGRLDVQAIVNGVGDLSNKRFFLCGPVSMVESMIAQLTKAGVKPSNIIYEEFNFKS
jgi:predicted ferric reductase